MKTAIIIPARYGSTRFLGKPLAMIAGQSMLARVSALAKKAAAQEKDIHILVATDDERIVTHARDIDMAAVMTSPACATGTDRVLWAMRTLDFAPDFILNLQGDAPLTPPSFVRALIESFRESPCDVVTPVVRMTWDELDALRTAKTVTPFSGTTAIFDEKTGRAFWFSKNIIPAIRKEKDLRAGGTLCPIFRHIGLYGYACAALEAFSALPEGRFEALEGLEQLRLIENGIAVRCVPVEGNGRPGFSGIDSPEDIARAEAYLAKYGES